MPVYRSRTVLEVARNVRAFLELNAGLIRGEVPDLEQVNRQLQNRVEQLRNQLAGKDRQLQRVRERLPGEGRPIATDKLGARNVAGREKEAGQAIVGDPRDHFIGRVARGRSFADVGGLYGTVSEKLSVAHSHGATELAMIDIVPEGNELWQAFSDRMQYLGISGYETISDRWMVAGTQALNKAMSMARGDFVTHLDDDDEYIPDRLEKLVEFAIDNRCDFVWHPCWSEDQEGNWKLIEAPSFAHSHVTTSSVFYRSWFTNIEWNVDSHLLMEPGDWNRFRRIKYIGPVIMRYPEPLLKHYRQMNQS